MLKRIGIIFLLGAILYGNMPCSSFAADTKSELDPVQQSYSLIQKRSVYEKYTGTWDAVFTPDPEHGRTINVWFQNNNTQAAYVSVYHLKSPEFGLPNFGIIDKYGDPLVDFKVESGETAWREYVLSDTEAAPYLVYISTASGAVVSGNLSVTQSAVSQSAEELYYSPGCVTNEGSYVSPILSTASGKGNAIWLRYYSLSPDPTNILLYKYKSASDLSQPELVMKLRVEKDSGLIQQQKKYTADDVDSSVFQIVMETDTKDGLVQGFPDARQIEYEPFSDISGNSIWQPYIAYVYQNKLFSGTSADTFSPDMEMTRAQLVTVLGNMHQKVTGEAIQGQKCSFPDVSADAYYAKYIDWAQQNGLVSGFTDGKFHPNDTITREQFAVIINKYIEVYDITFDVDENYTSFYELEQFDSDGISNWAKQAVDNMGKYGIMSGAGGYYFYPKRNVVREEAAVVFFHLHQNLSK